MKPPRFDWSCEASATKHGFAREEIESAFSVGALIFKVGKRAYMLLGKDRDGSLVEVAFRVLSSGKVLVFHCMEMRASLKKRYRRQRR